MADTWEVISGYSATDYVDTMTFEVDAETKKLAKLSGQTLVAGEKNSQYIQIRMPRYWDGIDISEMSIGIIYDLNNSEYFGTTQAISAERTTDSIRFGWVVPEEACAVKGTLLFVIIVKGTDYILKTQIADTPVVKSLSEDGDIPEPTKEAWYADFQVRIERTLSSAENAVEEAQAVLEQARSFVGSPLVAETAAGMVDTERIYVYTGSESGYTSGNWYYYNTGTSAWTSGGVYNAVAVDTDTTLTIAGKPADSKKTGDEISQIKEDFNDIESIILTPVEASGSVVEIQDGKNGKSFSSFSIGILPTRSGTGDASPTNPRPFTGGFTTANIYVSPSQDVSEATVTAVTFPEEAGTVYSATLNVVEGTLTVNGVYKKLVGNGNEGVSTYSGSRFRVSAPGFKSPVSTVVADIRCNIMKNVNKGAMGSNAYRISASDTGRAELLMIAETSFSTTAQLNEWLSENNVEIVYPLDTPVEYDLTPQQIAMVTDGINYAWSNAGDVSLTFTVGVDDDIDELKNGLNNIDADQCTFITEQPFKNVYNPDDAEKTPNSIIRASNAISSVSDFCISGYIPCVAGQTYILPVYTHKFGTGSAAKTICLFDANKNFLSNVTGTLGNVTSMTTSTSFLTFTVPSASTAKYFRVNTLEDDVNNVEILSPFHTASNFMVIEGTTFPSRFYPYAEQPIMDEQIYSGHENLSNPLYGKTVVFLGDSICEGDALGGWASRIGKHNTMLWENQGIGGSTISTALPSKTICTRAVRTVDPDYIILEGGTNDADRIGNATGETKPSAFGTWDADEYGTNDAETYYGFDIGTFCGAVDYMCKRFVALYPSAKIGFIGAHKMGTTDSTRANRGYYIKTAMEICKKWGIPCIDLWNESHLNPKIPSHYTTGEDYLYKDGQHLTANGYDVITPKIEAFMKTL